MLLLILAYAGGVLTIVSPCILPILPFVFARADQPFRRSGLPLLAGMAVTFAAVASLAAVAGGWAVRADRYGRTAALILFALFGATLLFSGLAERLFRPLVWLGDRLGDRASRNSAPRSGVLPSLLLGIGAGLLWAPCAGPILGLVLTGAAVGGASARTSLLLLVYAAGAVTSLALALLAGGRALALMKRSLAANRWIRRSLGIAVLAAVTIVACGLDRGLLTRLSLSSTSGLEQHLLTRLHPRPVSSQKVYLTQTIHATMGDFNATPTMLPSLAGATGWINSPPLTPASLRGKVVLVDFWTYSCINCLRTLPYLRAWYAKYKESGFVVLGIHTPEFPFEKNEANVRQAVRDLGISYPVALDNNYSIWQAFNNQYWPADYFVDATGRVRYHQVGEGDYTLAEDRIRGLLEEARQHPIPAVSTAIVGAAAEAPPDARDDKSPETYLGYARSRNFVSPGGISQDASRSYRIPEQLDLNQWAFAGIWKDQPQDAVLVSPAGYIAFRFHARDLHLVLGPGADGRPIRFRVTLDGAPPGNSHGADIGPDGQGVVTGNRLYQLIRQPEKITDRIFRIEFLDPGLRAYSFTFG